MARNAIVTDAIFSDNINTSNDVIDVRDIIARIEELEEEQPIESDDDLAELDALKEVMEELKGQGGDEQWDGDWYPVTLIRDSYFADYAQELVTDCGYISKDMPSWIEIDWEATARNVQQDYTSIEIEGVTYWFR